MSLKDLFIKEKSYIIQVDYLFDLFLYIEGLDNFGCAISGDFDKNKLTDNLCIELHYNHNSECEDTEVEDYDIDYTNFGLETKIEDIIMCHYFENNELKIKIFSAKNN